jgi:hypothetical protein
LTDTRKVKALGNLLLKLETRNRNGSLKKIIILFISYLLPGLFLPIVLFRQSADPTGFQYVFLTYLFYSVLISFTVISELDNIIISKTEIDLFGTLPIDDNIVVNAKMYMIIRYLVVITIPLLLPGGVFYFLMIKSIPRFFLYYLSGLILIQFIVNIILLIYCFALNSFRLKNLSTYTYIFQVLLIFFLVIGYQFVSYTFTSAHSSSAISYIDLVEKSGALQYFPQAWFSFIPVSRNITIDYRMLVKSLLPLVITYLSFISLKLYLAENLGSIRERVILSGIFFSGSGKKKFFMFEIWNSFIEKIYIRNKLEQSSYTMLKRFFSRDKAVKLSIIPMMLLPAGLAIFAIVTNQLPRPFGNSVIPVNGSMHIAIFLTMLMIVNISLMGIKITGNPSASWIYNAYPMESVMIFKNGIRKFFVLYLLVPVSLLLFVLFTVKIPVYQALIHVLFIFSAVNLYNTICHGFTKTLPFTKENTVINSVQRIGSMLLAILAGIPLIALQIMVYRSWPDALLASAVMLTLTAWLNYFIFIRRKTVN